MKDISYIGRGVVNAVYLIEDRSKGTFAVRTPWQEGESSDISCKKEIHLFTLVLSIYVLYSQRIKTATEHHLWQYKHKLIFVFYPLLTDFDFCLSPCLSFSNKTINPGKSTPLIRNVSNRIPTATINPNTNSNSIGCVIRTANVAARIKPAEEMTPPV